MKEININKLDEIIYEEVLDNGFKILLYPTKKSKNFYITLTTRFGGKDLKFKKNDKEYNIYPGTAHFLEHKVMNLGDEEKQPIIDKLGSSPNAYTSYLNTTYEIYGSKDIITNIKVLFDLVFSYKVTNKSIEAEKKIIAEEIDMCDDDIYTSLNKLVNKNIFINSSYKHEIIGTKEDINKIDKEYLDFIYDSFYDVSNMYCVITGDFDKDEVNSFIKEYVSKIKPKKDKVSIIKEKEPNKILNNFIEKQEDVVIDKVCEAYKLSINLYKEYDIKKVLLYYALMFNSLFGSTSEFSNKIKEDKIIEGNISAVAKRYDDYIIIKIIANTSYYEEYLKRLDKLLTNINISEEDFNRKKKGLVSSLILSFEDIEMVNDILTYEEINDNKINDNRFDLYNSLNYKEFIKIVDLFKRDLRVNARIYK